MRLLGKGEAECRESIRVVREAESQQMYGGGVMKQKPIVIDMDTHQIRSTANAHHTGT